MTDRMFIEEGKRYAKKVKGKKLPKDAKVFFGNGELYTLPSMERLLDHMAGEEMKKDFRKLIDAIYTDIVVVSALTHFTEQGILVMKAKDQEKAKWKVKKELKNTSIMVNALERKFKKVYGKC